MSRSPSIDSGGEVRVNARVQLATVFTALNSRLRAMRRRITAGVAVGLTIRAGLSVLLVFVSLREFLLQPGYYVYADQFWSILPSLPSSQAYTPLLVEGGRVSVVSFPQFTRDIISWPSVVLGTSLPSYQLTIRAFVFFSFLLFVLLCWVLAELILRELVRRTSFRPSPIVKLLIEVFVVVCAYCNFLSIQLNADGGTLSDGLILVVLSVCIFLAATQTGWTPSFAIAFSLCFILFLDPDYYVAAVVAIFLTAVVAGAVDRHLRRHVATVIVPLALSLPILLYVIEGLALTGPPGSLSSARSIQDAAGLSRNLNFWSATNLYGYAWSTVVFAPPSILQHQSQLSTMPGWGTPTSLLLPGGSLTTVWLVSDSALPLMAFLSLLAHRRYGSITHSAGLVAVLGVILALYSQIPPVYDTLSLVTGLPVVGQAIGTSLAVPDHLLVIVCAAYLVMAPVTLFSLAEWAHAPMIEREPPVVATRSGRWLRNRARSSGGVRRLSFQVCALIAVAALLFSGWQALDGSFYPARADNSTFEGNGVPSTGAFSPFTVDNETLAAYHFMFSNGSNFNVYWPIGFGIGMSGTRVGLLSVPMPDFATLLASGEFASVQPYLLAHGVRYVVDQAINNSTRQFYIPNIIPSQYDSNPYLYYFGLKGFSSVSTALSEVPGLHLALGLSSIEVFEVTGDPGLIYQANLLVNYPLSASEDAATYGVFQQLGYRVAISGASSVGLPLSYGGSGPGINILTPSNLSADYFSSTAFPSAQLPTYLPDPLEGIRYSANTSTLSENSTWQQNQSMGQYNVNVSGFVFTNWAGAYNVSIHESDLSLYSARGASFTLNYGGPATYDARGIQVLTRALPIATGMAGELSLSDPGSAEISSTFVAENATSKATLAFVTKSLPASSTPVALKMSDIIPNGTQYFTYRLGGKFTGFLNISYYNVSILVVPLLSSTAAPLGGYLSLENVTLPISNQTMPMTVLASGSGTINGMPLNATTPGPIDVGKVSGLVVNGTASVYCVLSAPATNLSGLAGAYVVYNGGDAVGILLSAGGHLYAPMSTNFGTNLYVLPRVESYTLVAPSIQALEDVYPVAVLYLGVLLVISFSSARAKIRRTVLALLSRGGS